MSSLVLTGSTSGTVSVQAPAVAGSNTATLAAATGTHYPFTAGTAVASTSGTSIDFTSIPSWVKRITVIFKAVSTNGSSLKQIQIGTSGGVETTSYVSSAAVTGPASAGVSSTTGFVVQGAAGATTVESGSISLVLVSSAIWVASGVLGREDAAGYVCLMGGSKTLSGTLDRIRITTVNGTDTFDAGSINILYE